VCSVLLLVALLFSITVPFASAYSDVTRSAFPSYFDAINYVTDNGLMNGTSSTTFEPNTVISRAMIVTTLHRLAGSPASYASVNFTDVSSSAWYYNAVRWAVKYGITTGATTTTFEPDSTVTREQAVTFFYRYLQKYRGVTPIVDMSITSCGDYANIYDYAITPFRWAVSNGIVYPDSSSNKRLYPKAGVYRKELALWICRFGTNVEGIRAGIDTFSFSNQPQYFASATAVNPDTNETPKKYLISTANYTKLLSQANKSEAALIASFVKSTEWLGACYGLSMSLMLDKYGVIDLNGNYTNSCKTIYSMPQPSDVRNSHHKAVYNKEKTIRFTQLEDTINYYLLTQFVKSKVNISECGGEFDNKVNASGTPAKGLVDSLKKGGIVMVNYSVESAMGNSTWAHSVLLYGKPTLNNGYYDIKCWDSMDSNTPARLRVKSDYKSCYFVTGTGTIGPSHVVYYSSYYGLLPFDIDGVNNGRAASPSKQESTTWIYADTNADCTITNADGEVLRSEYGIASGDMEILDTKMIVLGEGMPARMAWKVRASESFHFETESDECGFYAEIDEELYAVTGTGISTVDFSKNKVNVAGTNIDYRVISTANMEDNHYICYYGSEPESLELSLDGTAPLMITEGNQHAEIVDVRDLSSQRVS
jgi:hypothetical protein